MRKVFSNAFDRCTGDSKKFCMMDGNIGLESSDEDICILEDTIEDSFQIEDEKNN